MAEEKLFDLTGREYKGSALVTLRPGIGVRVNGEHIEGGPHWLPVVLANDLVHTNRAVPVDPASLSESERPAVNVERIHGDEPVATQITHRDPTPPRRR